MNRRTILGVLVAGVIIYLFVYFSNSTSRDNTNPKQYKVSPEISDRPQKSLSIEAEDASNFEQTHSLSSEYISAEDKRINALIEKLVDKDVLLSQEAAEELVSLEESIVPHLVEKLAEASVSLRGQITFILGRIGDNRALPALIEMLRRDDNAYVRRNSAEALGKIKDGQAIDTLVFALSDEDGGVRQRSAWALGELADPWAVYNLIDCLGEEKEERVKSTVVNSLGKLQSLEATQILLSELKSEVDQEYKDTIVTSLGQIGDIEALPKLTKYLNQLKSNEPTEPILRFQWEQAIETAESAIGRIKANEERLR
jgi:HEAT repeat protein